MSDSSEGVSDPETRQLATIADKLSLDYKDRKQHWLGSPFSWILTLKSRTVGKVGEQLIDKFLSNVGFTVLRTGDSEADRTINGKRAEIKFSTLWDTGIYKFQQIRDQNYSMLVCLGVSPFEAHLWAIEKTEVMRRWAARDGITGQHTGSAASDTGWLSVDPQKPVLWLRGRGGSLRDGVAVLRKLAP